jgi:hypothetical protein
MYIVNRNDKRGGCKKQKLLKTCGVALVVLTAMMKKGFAESPIKKGCEWLTQSQFFFAPISERGLQLS